MKRFIMKQLFDYINEAVVETGIGAFEWGDLDVHVDGGGLPTVVIDQLQQRLPGMGFRPTKNHVKNNEYKITHDGYCMVIGVRPRKTGEGTRNPSCKIFVRQCTCGKLSIVEKYLNIDGDGKAKYKVLSVNGDKFVWNECDVKELPKCGDIENTVEFSEMLIKKIQARTQRYTK